MRTSIGKQIRSQRRGRRLCQKCFTSFLQTRLNQRINDKNNHNCKKNHHQQRILEKTPWKLWAQQNSVKDQKICAPDLSPLIFSYKNVICAGTAVQDHLSSGYRSGVVTNYRRHRGLILRRLHIHMYLWGRLLTFSVGDYQLKCVSSLSQVWYLQYRLMCALQWCS